MVYLFTKRILAVKMDQMPMSDIKPLDSATNTVKMAYKL